RNGDERVTAFVEVQSAGSRASPHDLARVGYVHVEVLYVARAATYLRIARGHHVQALQQSHPAVHLEAKVRHRLRRRPAKQVDDGPVHVVRELRERPGVPVGVDALGVERGEFALELADHGEVQVRRLTRRSMAQDRASLAGVVVAVVAEIHHPPTDLGLQPSRRSDLRHQEATREEAAGLLAERDDRLSAHTGRPSWARTRGGKTACRTTLNATHALQPMMLYQRYPMLSERYITITRPSAARAAKKTALPPTRR